MFKQSLICKESQGVDKLIYNSTGSDLYANTVPSGRTTMFPLIDVGLTKEMTALAPVCIKVKTAAPLENKIYSAWIDDSILSLSIFEEIWITKDE